MLGFVNSPHPTSLKADERKSFNTYFNKKDEREYYTLSNLTSTSRWDMSQFKPNEWAGIDCSGLVQRSMMVGRKENQWAIDRGIKLRISPLRDEYNVNGDDTGALVVDNLDCDGTVNRCLGAGKSLPQLKTGHVYKMKKESGKLLRKGDLVIYEGAIDHIAIVHDEPSCNGNGTEAMTCTYDIIHAHGQPCSEYKRDRTCKEGKFSRKVIVTPNTVSKTIKNPDGFGRIKLWD